ncbi:MAG: hypothetical protein ACPG4T_13430 [Nannocystaceae bacterium]
MLICRRIRVPTLALAAVLCLSACGGGDDADSDSRTTGVTLPTNPSSSATTDTDTANASESDTTPETTEAPTTAGSESETPTESESDTTTDATTDDTTTDDTTTDDTTTETTDDPTSDTTDTTSGGGECSQIDFVFAIDNSVSMEGEQAALNAAFPQFIETIKSEVTTDDYHIMVVDTDAETRCTPDACNGNPHETCNGYACMTEQFVACDNTRGAGVLHPAGDLASNTKCEPFGGKRYILEGEPNMVDTFVCMATVGTAGHPSERPVDALVEAVSEPLNMPGGCNEGFLREDAILVLTFISDDPNIEDENSAMAAYEAIVAAKGGDLDRTVVLGLIIGSEVGCAVDNKPNAGNHWVEFINLFDERGLAGPVCSDDYNMFFQDAVATIADTCKINPPE